MKQGVTTALTLLLIVAYAYVFAVHVAPGKRETAKVKYTLTVEAYRLHPPVYDDSTTRTFKITLTNNTSDTLRYMSMSCSRWQFYIFDIKGVGFDDEICEKNIPIILKVYPHNRLKFLSKIHWYASTQQRSKPMSFRVGLDLEIEKPGYADKDFIKIRHKNLIWSNSVNW